MNSFKVCFDNLKTEDLEKYVQLAQEELRVRKKKAFTEASNKLISSIKEFFTSFPTARIIVDDEDASISLKAMDINSIEFQSDANDYQLEISKRWE